MSKILKKMKKIMLLKVDLAGAVVDGGAMWDEGDEYARARAAMPPRPETDYGGEVACPSCGRHRPKRRTERWCVPCANAGHNYRLMGRAELIWSAELQRRLGYAAVAAGREALAATLPPDPRFKEDADAGSTLSKKVCGGGHG